MSTGRATCPPDWAVQLTNLINAIANTNACTGLPLLPLCDATGATVGFAAAIYNCMANQVTVLKFDANLQPVTTLATDLHPCPTGACPPQAQLFQSSDLVYVADNGGTVRPALHIVTRDASGLVVNTRLQELSDPAATVTGTIVHCPCA